MLEGFAEKFRKINKTIESIRKDAYNGDIKNLQSRNSPPLFNSNSFQSDLAMIKDPEPLDPFSEEMEDIERRDNLLAYYAAITDAFAGRDFEQKPYVKED